MKKIMLAMVTLLAVTSVMAAPTTKKSGSKRSSSKPAAAAATESSDSQVIEGNEGKVTILQPVRMSRQACLEAPSVPGRSVIGQVYTKPRQWIVLEAKYETKAKWYDQLNFTWHVLLDTSTANNKGGAEEIPPYSYFTAQINYMNIPKGTHASSVVLHPSYLERYGEAKVVGVVITDKTGAVVGGNSWSEIDKIKAGTMFWDDPDIMDAKRKDGTPMIERRTGLVDRAKTIWGLVNPNDYENTVL